jgi:hypothetical protein
MWEYLMVTPRTLPYITVGELGDTLQVQSWRIARLFELGILPEPPRVGRNRAIPKTMVPQIVDELRASGWLPEQELGVHGS